MNDTLSPIRSHAVFNLANQLATLCGAERNLVQFIEFLVIVAGGLSMPMGFEIPSRFPTAHLAQLSRIFDLVPDVEILNSAVAIVLATGTIAPNNRGLGLSRLGLLSLSNPVAPARVSGVSTWGNSSVVGRLEVPQLPSGNLRPPSKRGFSAASATFVSLARDRLGPVPGDTFGDTYWKGVVLR